MSIKIVSRYNSGRVLYTGSEELQELRAVVVAAVKAGADLTGAILTDAEIPIIPNIDAAILAAIDTGGKLDMSTWHTCKTTHCRAGWAVTLAGEAGKKLEDLLSTGTAAALIYSASRPGMPVPNWYASDEEALEDLRKGAASNA